MDTVTLQVPMSNSIKKSATLVAGEHGFSSLQEAVRIFVTKLAKRQVNIGIFEEPYIQLSAKAIKRYNKITEEIESGKARLVTANSVQEHFRQLGI